MQPPETTEQDRNRRNSVEKQLIEKLPELIYAQKYNLRHTHYRTKAETLIIRIQRVQRAPPNYRRPFIRELIFAQSPRINYGRAYVGRNANAHTHRRYNSV